MTDWTHECWDPSWEPKPGEISIVDALRWRDDIFFINSDRLSGLKPSIKKRIREDLREGNPAFSVFYEPSKKLRITESDCDDIPLPRPTIELEAATLFAYQHEEIKVIPLPAPKTNPESSTLFCNIDVRDKPLPEDDVLLLERDISNVSTDSGFSESISSVSIEERSIFKFNFDPENLRLSTKLSSSSECAVFVDLTSDDATCENIPKTDQINGLSNPFARKILDDVINSDKEEGEISDSDSIEPATPNYGFKYSIDFSIATNNLEEVELSDYEEGEIIEKDNNYKLERRKELTDTVNDNVSKLTDYEDGELTENETYCKLERRKELNEAVNDDLSELSDYEEGELTENEKPRSTMESLSEVEEFGCSQTDLNKDLESDLALLIEKMEGFHLDTASVENATDEIVHLMISLQLEGIKCGLPNDLIEKLEELKLSAINEEEISVLGEKLSSLALSLKRDLKHVTK